MDIDRQAIERRDFPIARRGYEPAAVDAHLRSLASEIEELQRERADGGPASLASTAGTQVQSILAAAEAAAAEIEQQARDSARTTREEADRDAASTREQAIAQARGQVAFVANATAVLLERVNTMDGEVSALVESLRAGANRLAADLAAVETNMGELYDAASGQGTSVTRAVSPELPVQPSIPAPPSPPSPTAVSPAPPVPSPAAKATPPLSPPEATQPEVHVDPEVPPEAAAAPVGASSATAENGDLDGARLVALNMALNGESREDADRYLAENYELADRQKLINEVFAAIEG